MKMVQTFGVLEVSIDFSLGRDEVRAVYELPSMDLDMATMSCYQSCHSIWRVLVNAILKGDGVSRLERRAPTMSVSSVDESSV